MFVNKEAILLVPLDSKDRNFLCCCTKIGKFLARGKTQSVPDVFVVACTTHVDTYRQQRGIQRAGQSRRWLSPRHALG